MQVLKKGVDETNKYMYEHIYDERINEYIYIYITDVC